MRALIRWGGGCLAFALVTSVSHGQFYTPVTRQPYPTAPDMCGPGWYSVSPEGMVYGPNYYVYPPFAPFQGSIPPMPGRGGPQAGGMRGGMPGGNGGPNFAGMMPQPPQQPGQQQIINNFPTHPYARGPRDFFMWNEQLEEMRGRTLRPGLVP